MFCIYFKDKQDLNFNSGEHIFPRMVGGKVKLSKGVVSDEANKMFDKLEKKVVSDNNFISVFKKMLPSLSRHKDVIKPFVVKYNNGEKAVHYKKNDTETKVLTSGIISKTANNKKWHSSNEQQLFEDLNSVQKNSENVLLESTVFKVDTDNVGVDEVIMGIYNCHAYVFTSKLLNEEQKVNVIRIIHSGKISDIIENEDKGSISTKYSPIINLGKGLEWWLNAKTAFNVLVRIKGKEFVLDIGFDNFRESVIEWREPTSDGTNNISVEKWELLSGVFNDISTNWAYVLFNGGNVKIHVSLLGQPPRGYDIGTHTQEKIDGQALCFELNGNFEILWNDEVINFIALKKHPDMMKLFLMHGGKNSKLSRIIHREVNYANEPQNAQKRPSR